MSVQPAQKCECPHGIRATPSVQHVIESDSASVIRVSRVGASRGSCGCRTTCISLWMVARISLWPVRISAAGSKDAANTECCPWCRRSSGNLWSQAYSRTSTQRGSSETSNLGVPVFYTPDIWSRIFRSCIFHYRHLVLHFQHPMMHYLNYKLLCHIY